jgi:nickel-dependent lactate racemase
MSKKVKIPYNKSFIELEIPEKNITNLIGSEETLIPGSNVEKLEIAFRSNEETPIAKIVENKKIVLIVEDHTREVPFADRFNVLFPLLNSAKQMKVFIATGTHDGEVDDNYRILSLIEEKAGKFNLEIDKIVIHNCHSDEFYYAGTTTIGNDIYVNKEIQDAEIIIILSDMKNHYFAGYSNPLKSLLPGICKYETIERNHALTLNEKATFGRHPLHPDKNRRDNPLAQDMFEGFNLIVGDRPVFVLGTICKNNRIQWAKFGSLEEVSTEGMLQVDALSSVQVESTDKIIISSGGYPNDESLYISQRALELSKNAVKDGGEILFISGCANGIGPKKSVRNFYEPLKEDIDTILNKLSEKYIMYSHKTYKFAQLIQRMKSIYFYTELSENEIESIHLRPTNSPQEIVNSWLKKNEYVKINIFTEGNKVAVYKKEKILSYTNQ